MENFSEKHKAKILCYVNNDIGKSSDDYKFIVNYEYPENYIVFEVKSFDHACDVFLNLDNVMRDNEELFDIWGEEIITMTNMKFLKSESNDIDTLVVEFE